MQTNKSEKERLIYQLWVSVVSGNYFFLLVFLYFLYVISITLYSEKYCFLKIAFHVPLPLPA